MGSSPGAEPITANAFMALLDDRADRELIRGIVRERPRIFHSPAHGLAVTKLIQLLKTWEDDQPEPHGEVCGYGAPFLLQRDPDTLVGCDVSYVSAEAVAATSEESEYYEGPPTLAIEILEPWDQPADVIEKVRLYLRAGAVVWIIDPRHHRVEAHRPGQEPEVLHATQVLSGDPVLAGFHGRVSDLFR